MLAKALDAADPRQSERLLLRRRASHRRLVPWLPQTPQQGRSRVQLGVPQLAGPEPSLQRRLLATAGEGLPAAIRSGARTAGSDPVQFSRLRPAPASSAIETAETTAVRLPAGTIAS